MVEMSTPMKVFRDITTGDKMCDDTFSTALTFEGTCLEVSQVNDFGTNLVEKYMLCRVPLNKEEFIEWSQIFLNKRITKLRNEDKSEKIEAAKASMSEAMGFIMKVYDGI